MPVSPLQAARRAFATVLLQLARAYSVSLAITRDSTDKQLEGAFKRLAVKVHPDKGGVASDFQQLNNARDTWKQLAGKQPKPQPQSL